MYVFSFYFFIVKLNAYVSVKFNKIFVYKYFYYCVHMCTLSKLCHSEWHRNNYADIFSL